MIDKNIDFTDIKTVENVTGEGHIFSLPFHRATDRVAYPVPYVRKSLASSEDDSFHLIEAGEEGRLDLISFKWYGTVDFWRVLAEYNNIPDPLDFEAGVYMRIPAVYRVMTDILGR